MKIYEYIRYVVFFIVLNLGFSEWLLSMPSALPSTPTPTTPAAAPSGMPSAMPSVTPVTTTTPTVSSTPPIVPPPTIPITTTPSTVTPALPTAVSATSAPAAVTSALATPATGSIVSVTGTTAVPAPLAAAKSQGYQTELSQLNSEVEKLHELKKNVKTLLAQFDDQLTDAQKQALEAKKLSMDVLSKENPADAKSLLDAMEQQLKKVQAVQTFAQDTVQKSLDEATSKAQDQIKKIQETMKALQIKGIEFHATQMALEKTKEEARAATQAAATPAVANAKKAAAAQPGVWGAIVRVGTLFYDGVIAVKNWLFPVKSDEDQKKKINELKTKNPQAAATMTSIDDAVQKLEAQKQKVYGSMGELEASVQVIAVQLKSNMTTEKHVSALQHFEGNVGGKWKVYATRVFSYLLDLVDAIVHAGKKAIEWCYKTLLADLVNKFIKDVQQKSESQKAAPATAPASSTAASTTPVATPSAVPAAMPTTTTVPLPTATSSTPSPIPALPAMPTAPATGMPPA